MTIELGSRVCRMIEPLRSRRGIPMFDKNVIKGENHRQRSSSPNHVRRPSLHVFLETERLILRRFTDDDVGNLYDLDSDPEVMHYITGGATTPREEIEHDFLPAFMSYYDRGEGYGFWAAIDKTTGRFQGWFHLRPPDWRPRRST